MAAIKIPKYIRQKMHRIAYLHATANKEMQVVEAWLENQGFDTSMQGLRCGNGYSLEEKIKRIFSNQHRQKTRLKGKSGKAG